MLLPQALRDVSFVTRKKMAAVTQTQTSLKMAASINNISRMLLSLSTE